MSTNLSHRVGTIFKTAAKYPDENRQEIFSDFQSLLLALKDKLPLLEINVIDDSVYLHIGKNQATRFRFRYNGMVIIDRNNVDSMLLSESLTGVALASSRIGNSRQDYQRCQILCETNGPYSQRYITVPYGADLQPFLDQYLSEWLHCHAKDACGQIARTAETAARPAPPSHGPTRVRMPGPEDL